jgi:hypothetical protein
LHSAFEQLTRVSTPGHFSCYLISERRDAPKPSVCSTSSSLEDLEAIRTGRRRDPPTSRASTTKHAQDPGVASLRAPHLYGPKGIDSRMCCTKRNATPDCAVVGLPMSNHQSLLTSHAKHITCLIDFPSARRSNASFSSSRLTVSLSNLLIGNFPC